MNTQTWLVVPLYNEASVIGEVITAARQTFPHIVCVDDGSRDDSARCAEAAGAYVVRHPINLGQGAALQTGIEFALADPQARWFCTFDADGQHQTADVEAMLAKATQEDLDLVLGSRFLDERTKPSFLKKMVLRAAVAYTNATTGTRLTDAHNGLRLMSRPVAERLHITQDRMAHASEIVDQFGAMRIDGRPLRYGEAPVHILYTDYSKAKGQSLWNSVNILFELMFK